MSVVNSASLKFDRAQKHFDSLRHQVDRALEPGSFRVRSEANADLTEHRFHIEFRRAVPGGEWGLILGDGIHCLRSALDHSVYAIGVKDAGTDPPPDWRRLAFPISSDAAGFEKDRWRIKSLSLAAQEAIAGLQPHEAQKEFFARPLGFLQELDNADKHRAIRIVAVVPVAPETLFSGLVPGAECTLDHRVAPLKDDVPFMTLRSSVPTPNLEVAGHLALEVGIPWVRANGVETTVLVWPAVEAMNQAVRDALTVLTAYV